MIVTAHSRNTTQPRSHRRARKRSSRLLPAAVASLAVLAGCLAVGMATDAEGDSSGPDPGNEVGAAGDDVPGRSESSVPRSGSGTFTTAEGDGGKVGRGRLLRYKVEVEKGIGLSAPKVAAEVGAILADKRGWTGDGQWAFRRVSGGTPDFVVRVATPDTVDKICGGAGLDTGGEVNCRAGVDVVVNLKRWLLATRYYDKDVPGYRALIINHEVGHFLGHGHESCPGGGEPAPVMMQQIKGLKGCKPNVWPFTRNGRPITGPPTQ
jgi:hypothetical protein